MYIMYEASQYGQVSKAKLLESFCDTHFVRVVRLMLCPLDTIIVRSWIKMEVLISCSVSFLQLMASMSVTHPTGRTTATLGRATPL